MKIYLVKYKQGEKSSVIDDRIRNAGPYYALSDCEFLVFSSYDKARELYDDIVKNDFQTLSIIVFAIDPTIISGYWGVSNNELWDWLRDNSGRVLSQVET